MARTIFLLLLLLNLIAFAWIYLTGEERANAGREPQRVKAMLAADRIRLVPANSAPIALLATETTLSSVAATAAGSCQAYAGATLAEAAEVAKAWSDKLPAARITHIPVTPPPLFDMVIPALTSRAAADTKLAELKKLGVGNNAQIRSESDKRFAILMASFTQRTAADEALKTAAQKGVRSAVIAQRQPEPERATIEVRGSDAELKSLTELAAALKNLVAVACSSP